MVKFNNRIVENLCEELLTEEGNRIKISYGGTINYQIGSSLGVMSNLLSDVRLAEENLAAAKKALLISQVAYNLKAKLVMEKQCSNCFYSEDIGNNSIQCGLLGPSHCHSYKEDHFCVYWAEKKTIEDPNCCKNCINFIENTGWCIALAKEVGSDNICTKYKRSTKEKAEDEAMLSGVKASELCKGCIHYDLERSWCHVNSEFRHYACDDFVAVEDKCGDCGTTEEAVCKSCIHSEDKGNSPYIGIKLIFSTNTHHDISVELNEEGDVKVCQLEHFVVIPKALIPKSLIDSVKKYVDGVMSK